MRRYSLVGLVFTLMMSLLFCTGYAGAETVTLDNGMVLNYETKGNGPVPIVFIHGYGFDAGVWSKVLDNLPEKYKAYAYDLRGFGDSSKPEQGYGLDDFVDDLKGFLDAMKISQAVLVGHSLGGIFLQDFATTYPDRVLALVLSNPQARHKDFGGKVPEGIARRLAAYGDREANREIFEKSLPRYFKAGNLSDEDLARFLDTALKSSTPALKESFAKIFTSPAIPEEKFALITMPTLIIGGTHDIVPFSVAVSLSEVIPQSRIFIVEGAGHVPMWEKPDRFSEGLFGFLDHEL